MVIDTGIVTGSLGLSGPSGVKLPGAESQEGTFSGVLKDAVNNLEQIREGSTNATNAVMLGETDSLHQVMLEASKAEIALSLAVQVRNKAVDAYTEVMRMQF